MSRKNKATSKLQRLKFFFESNCGKFLEKNKEIPEPLSPWG